MASFRVAYTIDNPSTDVFAALLAVEDYPNWHPAIAKATKVTDGPTRPGTRFQGIARPFGKLDIELIAFEEPHRLHFRVDAKLARWDHRIILTPQADSTKILHDYEITPRGLSILAAPLIGLVMRRVLNKAMAAFEQHLKHR